MRFVKSSLGIIILIVFVFLIGCNNENIIDNDSSNETETDVVEYEPTYGGELVLPITHVDTLNPLLTRDKQLYYFNNLIYEGLFALDKNGDIKNVLVDTYTLSEDGRTIQIVLKNDVQWHDGKALTSSDVKFTIDTLRYGAVNALYGEILSDVYRPSRLGDLSHIISTRTNGEKSISIEFDKSYSNALESLIFPIIPRHGFEGLSDRNAYKAASNKDYDFKPIGTGPYKVENYEKLKRIELVANETWWGDKPYISKIIGQIIPDKEATITSFESGIIDVTTILDIDWEKYNENKNIDIYEYISSNYEFIGFNFNRNIFKDEGGKAIRKAIAYAIDRNAIIQNVYLGHATTIDVPIWPNSWLISEEGNTYGYNLTKAKNILKEAGWKDDDKDGILEDDKGNKLSISLLTNGYNTLRRESADIIKENLKEIGIDIKLKYNSKEGAITEEDLALDWESTKDMLYKGDYDMALLGWEMSPIPDISFAFHSSQIRSGSNFIGYKDSKMDQSLIAAFNAKNREEKKQKYKLLQQNIIEDLPYMSLFFKNNALLINNKVKGEIEPLPFNIYNNINKWYIPEENQSKDIE